MQMPLRPDSVSDTTGIRSAESLEVKGYRGLYGFHKYWGKKPHEPLRFVIERLSKEGSTVLDPFVGSGVTARESLIRNRRFIGFDINPVAIELSRLIASPPHYRSFIEGFEQVQNEVKEEITEAYRVYDGRIASHYLWDNDTLMEVWLRNDQRRSKEVLHPTNYDLNLVQEYANYNSRCLRSPQFFLNSRINTQDNLTVSDIVTGRAQRNIDLLMGCFNRLSPNDQPPIKLCLTAASGQMTKMVFRDNWTWQNYWPSLIQGRSRELGDRLLEAATAF